MQAQAEVCHLLSSLWCTALTSFTRTFASFSEVELEVGSASRTQQHNIEIAVLLRLLCAVAPSFAQAIAWAPSAGLRLMRRWRRTAGGLPRREGSVGELYCCRGCKRAQATWHASDKRAANAAALLFVLVVFVKKKKLEICMK